MARTPLTPCREPAPLPAVYFETVFLVPLPPGTWPETFAIVTAHNPYGESVPDQANNRYERKLRDYLRDQKVPAFVVVGASPDLAHHESGYAVETDDLQLAAKISARFEQRAFYWVQDGTIFLCLDGSGQVWEVAPWRERVKATS